MAATTTNSTAGQKFILTALHGREIGLGSSRQLIVRGEPSAVSFSATPGAANGQCLVTIQFTDNEGKNYPANEDPALGTGVVDFTWWLSDAATGIGLTATAASSTVAAGAAGTDLVALVSKKMTISQTNNTGAYQLKIIDTANTLYYVAVSFGKGSPLVSAQLVAGNYD